MLYDSLWDVDYDAHMGELTELLVDEYDIGRSAQDEYAHRSEPRSPLLCLFSVRQERL